jgi:hypothetical protein
VYALLPYLETFLSEASSRGLKFDAENLMMEFGTASIEICRECLLPQNEGQRKNSYRSKFTLLVGCNCAKP